MNINQQANAVYDFLTSDLHRPFDPLRPRLLFWKPASFSEPNGGWSAYKCPKCEDTLEYTYLEQALYAVRCTHCGCVHLVKAYYPEQAAGKVGLLFGK